MKTARATRNSRRSARTTSPTRERASAASLLPLHHRVYVALRTRLLAGGLPPESPLPGEHQLAGEFRVSRDTVRRVLQRLEREHLVQRRHGVGTFPVARRPVPLAAARKLAFYDFIELSTDPEDCRLLDFGIVPTPEELLREAPDFGARALRISRLRSMQRRPEHLIDSYLPLRLADGWSAREVGRRTVLELLAERGIEASATELWVGAMTADAHEAAVLRIEVGAALVHATRLSRDAAGRSIEFSRLHSVAEHFGYRFSFDRRALRPRRKPAARGQG